MVNQLSNALTSVKHEQEYMEVRERIHRASKLYLKQSTIIYVWNDLNRSVKNDREPEFTTTNYWFFAKNATRGRERCPA